MTLRSRIREARHAKGLTQQALAVQCDVAITSVQRWERGDTEPNLRYLARLAKALGVSIGWLLEEEEAQ